MLTVAFWAEAADGTASTANKQMAKARIMCVYLTSHARVGKLVPHTCVTCPAAVSVQVI